jgi:hypothetical protein
VLVAGRAKVYHLKKKRKYCKQITSSGEKLPPAKPNHGMAALLPAAADG